MTSQEPKRRYRNSLDHVEAGLRACWHNARDLVSASDKLFAANLHAPALSLAVLAIEELAKFVAIDGLLYATATGPKSEIFQKATKSHSVKLTVFEMFPLMLANLARADLRWGTDQAFHTAIAMSIQQMKQDGNDVMVELKGGAFEKLDEWKQRGFYTASTNSGFIEPSSAVSLTLATKVKQLAWRATTTLDFVLKYGNLERYVQNARSIRAKLSEKQHQELEAIGESMFADLFASLDTEDSSDSNGATKSSPPA